MVGQFPIQYIIHTDLPFSFLTIQHILLFLIAPSLAAGIISSERAQGTIEILLLTPGTSRGLVLQKFFAVFALFAAMPLLFAIVFSVYFYFMIFPDGIFAVLLVSGSYFNLLMALCCYIAISMYLGCLCKTTRSALALSYSVNFVLQLIITLTLSMLYILLFMKHPHGFFKYSNTICRLSFGNSYMIGPWFLWRLLAFSRSCSQEMPHLFAFCKNGVYLLITFFCLHMSSRHIQVLRGLKLDEQQKTMPWNEKLWAELWKKRHL